MCFRWEHACSLSPLTLTTLLKQQGGSIHTLIFREHTRRKKLDPPYLKIGGLETLGMAEVGISHTLSAELLTRNLQTLRHLRLGSELDLAREYEENGYIDLNEVERFSVTATFATIVQFYIKALKGIVVRLESLSLVGFDLRAFAESFMGRIFDLNNLSMLTLESCCDLKEALPLLVKAGDSTGKAKSAFALHTLAIRQESADKDFSRALEDFLLSLKPLAHLHVLLEDQGNYRSAIDLHKVLRVHGKCLRSLVWDERGPPIQHSRRVMLRTNPSHHETLDIVAKHCPGLKALGLSLDWADILEPVNNHEKVRVVLWPCIHLHADLA